MLRHLWLAFLVLGPSLRLSSAEDFQTSLNRMVDQEVVGAGITNSRVIESMRNTTRHEFMPAAQRRNAFFDMALPIGHGQSISPPFVVAYMTEKIDPQPTDKVLEIGTGSGYQAAVLSPLAKEVYTIEIVEPLGRTAATTLKRLGYKNVHTRVGDGYLGWPEEAPFDKIIVTCSPEKVPQPLIDQLRDGGRLIVPVGERFQQTLYLFKKVDGKLEAQALEPTMFVPMTGEAERQRIVRPDATKPSLVNGSFESVSAETGFPNGWYYIRHAKVQSDATAPAGRQVIVFTNDVPGRSARALQAMAVDGRAVSSLDISLWVTAHNVRRGASHDQAPRVVIAFFDENRAPIGETMYGQWTGSFQWRQQHGSVKVPEKTRMAIVWIGLLGATGEISFDDVAISPTPTRSTAGTSN